MLIFLENQPNEMELRAIKNGHQKSLESLDFWNF